MSITTVLLYKETPNDTLQFKKIEEIRKYYLEPLEREGITQGSVLLLPLLYNTPTKIIAKTAKAYLIKLKSKIPDTVTNLVIADSNYFKFITKTSKVSNSYGTVLKGAISKYTDYDCVYVPNYKSLFKQPENAQLITLGIKAIAGKSADIVINSEEYGFTHGSDREILDHLYQYPILTIDIETTGLDLEDEIISIAFAWSKHDGVAIDLSINGTYYLKKFFENYKGRIVFHNGLFDVKMLIRDIWMKHSTDYVGLLEGVHYLRNFDDTMVLAYLAKNATTQISLGLKDIALEYVGNYAIELENISKYTKGQILKYNLIDALATFYVYEKYKKERHSRPYKEIFKPSLYALTKMMLIGLPMNSNRVEEVHNILKVKAKVLAEQIQENKHVKDYTKILQEETCRIANSKLKKLVKTIDDFGHVEFNPSSHPQLGSLLFTHLELPVLEKTKSGAPSTGASALKDLANHTTDEETLDLLDCVQELADVEKINGTFIKAFMKEKDFLHGNLKLGGTQSGRLSSNSPNLTNLPAHGSMGKLVKSCIVAPDGWLFAGADFAALEERIGAILSKDPNRIKVYTDGYDGHSLRAQTYFADQMPDIDPTDVASINSIEHKYPELRRKSKGPTFALQYMGTAYTLHKRTGFSMAQAIKIEQAFHELYKVSKEFNDKNKEFMEQHGYVECAFGLKLRTPIVEKCILGNSKTPHEADKEVRSANNAITQSWGMLLNRAMNATNQRIEEAGYGTEILPCNMIHDAGYFLVKNTPEHIKFLNDVLIEEMEWNDDDAIRSIDVPMKASLEVGKSWDTLAPLNNNATLEEIYEIFTGSN
jgi:DNA polymerase-1